MLQTTFRNQLAGPGWKMSANDFLFSSRAAFIVVFSQFHAHHSVSIFLSLLLLLIVVKHSFVRYVSAKEMHFCANKASTLLDQQQQQQAHCNDEGK